MPTIEKITADHFDAIFAKYLQDDDPRVTRDQWKSLFTPVAEIDDQQGFGCQLLEAGKIVGMLGMRFSERTIQGRMHKFCNLHSWNVDPDHRGHSLRLLRYALHLPDTTLTDFTPTKPVCELSTRLGFQYLDSSLRLLPRLPWKRSAAALACDWNDQIDPDYLTADERRLIAEHRHIEADCLLMHTTTQRCFMMVQKVSRHWMPYAQVLFLGDPAVAAAHHWQLRKEITGRYRVPLVAMNNRTLEPHSIPFSMRLSGSVRQLYRPCEVAACDIDFLHSEVAMLQLTAMPGIRTWLPWSSAS